MGLFDYFIPDPPIECPNCEGVLTGWQGKHSGDMCLFVWQQGKPSPIDQKADLDCRLDDLALSTKRLEPAFSIYGGECSKCEFVWWNSVWQVICKTEQGIWTQTEIIPSPVKGEIVKEDWIVCQDCFNSWKAIRRKKIYLCSSCQKLVQV